MFVGVAPGITSVTVPEKRAGVELHLIRNSKSSSSQVFFSFDCSNLPSPVIL